MLCLDGTGNAYGSANTNVVKLYNLLERNDLQSTTTRASGHSQQTEPGLQQENGLPECLVSHLPSA